MNRLMIFIAIALAGVSHAKTAQVKPPYLRGVSDSELSLVKDAMTEMLKDPDSAKYKDVRVRVETVENAILPLCGKVNSKNSYGGYTGFTYFYGALGSKEGKKKAVVLVVDSSDSAMAWKMCDKDGLAN